MMACKTCFIHCIVADKANLFVNWWSLVGLHCFFKNKIYRGLFLHMQHNDRFVDILKQEVKLRLIRKYVDACDVLKWGKLLFPYKFKGEFCQELHQYLIDTMNEETTVVLAPRGSGKTIISCFLIPIYLALNHPDKYIHFLSIQSTYKKAAGINTNIRDEIANNELLKEYYGDLVSKHWTKDQFELTNGVVFTSIGCEGSLRGLNYKSYRPDYVIIDDLYDENDYRSREARERKEIWYFSSLFPAISSFGDTEPCIKLQGTAVASDDLYHKLKENTRYIFRKFQSIIDWEEKQVLWADMKTFEELMVLKESMPAVLFYREYQNDLFSNEESIINLDWIKYYDEINLQEEDIVCKMLGIDPSVGESKKSDYTGFAIVYRTIFKDNPSRSNYYVLRIEQHRMSMQDRIDYIVDLHKEYNFDFIFVEDVAAFRDFAVRLMNTGNLPVIPTSELGKGNIGKRVTLENKSIYFQRGWVFFNETIIRNPSDRALLEEQITINDPPHDDMRDALFLTLTDMFDSNVSFEVVC